MQGWVRHCACGFGADPMESQSRVTFVTQLGEALASPFTFQ